MNRTTTVILIAVVVGTAGVGASTMVAKPLYAAICHNGSQTYECSPPPIPGCIPPNGGVPSSDTRLTLQFNGGSAVQRGNVGILRGTLSCLDPGFRTIGGGPGIADATIKLTGSGVGMVYGAEAKTDFDGNYFLVVNTETPGTYNVQAHFSGGLLPRASSFYVTGSHSDIVTFVVR